MAVTAAIQLMTEPRDGVFRDSNSMFQGGVVLKLDGWNIIYGNYSIIIEIINSRVSACILAQAENAIFDNGDIELGFNFLYY